MSKVQKFENVKSLVSMKLIYATEIENLSILIFYINKYYVTICNKINILKKLNFDEKSISFKKFYKKISLLKNVLRSNICELLYIKRRFLKAVYSKFVKNYQFVKPHLYKKNLKTYRKKKHIFNKKIKKSLKFFKKKKMFFMSDKLYKQDFSRSHLFNLALFNVKKYKIKKYIFRKKFYNGAFFKANIPKPNIFIDFFNKKCKYRYYSIVKKRPNENKANKYLLRGIDKKERGKGGSRNVAVR